MVCFASFSRERFYTRVFFGFQGEHLIFGNRCDQRSSLKTEFCRL